MSHLQKSHRHIIIIYKSILISDKIIIIITKNCVFRKSISILQFKKSQKQILSQTKFELTRQMHIFIFTL